MVGNFLKKVLGIDTEKKDIRLTRDQIAELLNLRPEAYDAFEKAYHTYAFDPSIPSDQPSSLFDVSSKDLTDRRHFDREISIDSELGEKLHWIVDRTVDELLAQTSTIEVKDNRLVGGDSFTQLPAKTSKPLTPNDLGGIPKELRPQLLGNYHCRDTEGSTGALLYQYKMFLEEKNPEKKLLYYNMFRQGLDILDLEPLLYEMLKCDPNAMSKWLPSVVLANNERNFFKIPDTIIAQVPFTLLQLSRLEYMNLTDTTLRIVDQFCSKVFKLQPFEEYFIKTGTFSSKFDFRNAHVKGPKEINELGEYLLFLSNQAVLMASPCSQPSVYGVSTNNEWVVRNYIQDVEGNPCIYKGMPLHSEYRVFIDCDEKEVLGVVDYWDRDLLKERFSSGDDATSPHSIHDYIIVQKHREVMDRRFAKNWGKVASEVFELLPFLNLKGQWSLDVMQNGSDFYIIDMALAATSALKDRLPANVLKALPDREWLPRLTIKEEK